MHSIACPWVLLKIEERMSSRDRNVDSMTGTPECQNTVWGAIAQAIAARTHQWQMNGKVITYTVYLLKSLTLKDPILTGFPEI